MPELDDIIRKCTESLEDPNMPTVRAWKEAHPDRKVIGHFQVYFPEEIIEAGGWLPVKVLGGGNIVEVRQADAHIASFVCSIIRTSLEMGFNGNLSFLEGLITHPICDGARNVAGLWGRNFPDQLAHILYLPQNANSKGALQFLVDEYRRLIRELEARGFGPLTSDALRRSLGVFNENRRLMRELYRIKRETPWQLPLSEVYVLVRMAGMMSREEHNRLLRRVLELVPERQGRKQDKLRVVFEGGFCEQPPLDMLRALEENCYVVDDDFMIGLRWITSDVPEEGDPLHNLARAYLEQSTYSPVQHDQRKPKEEMLLERIRHSKADACIVSAAKMCEPGLDEQVVYIKTLEAEKIPYLVTEFEEKETVFENFRMQVETFVESIMFD